MIAPPSTLAPSVYTMYAGNEMEETYQMCVLRNSGTLTP